MTSGLSFDLKLDFNKSNVSNNLNNSMRLFLLKTMFEIEKEAKLRAPVDTGRLRASINTYPTIPSDVIRVSDGVNYGFFQEFGTSKMKAQPYFRPAIEIVLNERLKSLSKDVGLS